MPELKRYVIVGRASASTIFRKDELCSLTYRPDGDRPPARMIFRTRYLDKKLDHPIPEDIWVEIECEAESIQSAMDWYASGAEEIASVICLFANAHVGDLSIEIAFEITDGVERREYFQTFVPEMAITVISGRLLDVEALGAFIRAIASSPERLRIMRAIAQYQFALRYWTPGVEIPAVNHLFIAVENLAKAALRKHLRDRSIDDAELGKEWDYNSDRRMKLEPYLMEQARVRLVFHGDVDCYRTVKSVSDQFEHGLESFALLRRVAESVVVRAADHVRNAIIESTSVAAEAVAAMAKHTRPRGPLRLVKYLGGHLRGEPKNFAAANQAYPFLVWKSKLDRVTVDDDGTYRWTPEETFTGRFGEGVELEIGRFAVWDGSLLVNQPIPGVKKS